MAGEAYALAEWAPVAAEGVTTPSRNKTAWARNLASPVRDFLSQETGSAVVLLAATLVALAWANSPWSDTYESVWRTTLSIQIGDAGIATDLRHWVNQGLMTFFFLVVGLEAKRELDLGELRERDRLAIPVVAALGGMAVPVAIYLAFNAGGAGSDGWGTAMSTDTAFALGVLALLTRGQAIRLRVFLLTLAVVDDLVALLVIATFYTDHVEVTPLLIAIGLFSCVALLRFVSFAYRREVAFALGVATWVALFKSGVDPIISGLAVGLVTSAYPPGREDLERVTTVTRLFREQPTPELAREAQLNVASAISPNERLQYRLHPWTSYVIVPLFALANAGIKIDGKLLEDAATSPITLGIIVGYVVGKPLGILSATWLATRKWLGGAKRTLSWLATATGGAVAGIGFTVSLLIASIAFTGRQLAEAKVGILTSAVLAVVVAWGLTRVIRAVPASWRARQILGTADEILDLAEEVDPEVDHIRGDEDAPVTIIEYGDFECPYCGIAEEAIRPLLAEFDEDLRYVFRQLPLNDVHQHAQMAAEASEAAAVQGKFWEYHDALFGHQDELEPSDLADYARDLDLDLDRFETELRDREYAPRVARDVSSADESGVAGTPTFFINGRRHQGAYDLETLSEEVERARRRARLEVTAAAR